MRRVQMVVAGLLLAAGVVSAEAQSPQPTAAGSEKLRAAIGRLHVGDEVRIDLAYPNRVEGVLRPSVGDSIAIAQGRSEVRTDLAQVRALYTQEHKALKGAVIGGAVVGSVFAAAGVVLAQGLCENSNGCGSDAVGLGLVFGLSGAAGGALVGALIGSLVDGWKVVYPTPSS
ncbi:MAG: hypothetical protein JWO05_3555 [Gemmatimonadetes bacterium]|nr:hypothetical protein [Gemmatimonadota bacterium]